MKHLVEFNSIGTVLCVPRHLTCEPEFAIVGQAARTGDLEFALWCAARVGGPHVGRRLVAVEEQAKGGEGRAKVFMTILVVNTNLVGGAVERARTSGVGWAVDVDLLWAAAVEVVAV